MHDELRAGGRDHHRPGAGVALLTCAPTGTPLVGYDGIEFGDEERVDLFERPGAEGLMARQTDLKKFLKEPSPSSINRIQKVNSGETKIIIKLEGNKKGVNKTVPK